MKEEYKRAVAQQGKTGTKQVLGAGSPLGGVNMIDPTGVCDFKVGPVHFCNNLGKIKNPIVKIILLVWAIVTIFFADFFDIISWGIGLIPVVGDILGNTVVGNIIDIGAGITLFIILGPISLIGITEFADILGFIPVIGDFISLLEWLPAWTFILVMYGILSFLGTSRKNNGILAGLKLF